MNVIVTGGSRGIGEAIAMRFAKNGDNILICARDISSLASTAEKLRKVDKGIDVNYFAADLSDVSQVNEFASWCLGFGVPGILVNNAGTYLPGNCSDEPDGHLETQVATNLYSAYYMSRRLIPAMREQKKGHIFNICSVAGLKAYPGGGSYSITKFAMNGLSQNLRHELKDYGIKVTTVFPGAVLTDSWEGFDNSSRRIMESNDIADIIFTASNLSQQATVEEIIIRPQLGDL